MNKSGTPVDFFEDTTNLRGWGIKRGEDELLRQISERREELTQPQPRPSRRRRNRRPAR